MIRGAVDHRWSAGVLQPYGLDYEEWHQYCCSRCGLVVVCDRCLPWEDPEVEQDCDVALVNKVMES